MHFAEELGVADHLAWTAGEVGDDLRATACTSRCMALTCAAAATGVASAGSHTS
jgi:hypothetical protein